MNQSAQSIERQLDIMDECLPCNMCGVANGLVVICQYLRSIGLSTDEINNHEYVKRFVTNMAYMCHLSIS